MLQQSIVKSTSRPWAVAAPIVDEYAAGHNVLTATRCSFGVQAGKFAVEPVKRPVYDGEL